MTEETKPELPPVAADASEAVAAPKPAKVAAPKEDPRVKVLVRDVADLKEALAAVLNLAPLDTELRAEGTSVADLLRFVAHTAKGVRLAVSE